MLAPTRSRSARPRLLACLLLLAGCDDLAKFRGSYEGAEIVAGSFVRSCFPDKTQLSLQFYPELVLSPPEADRFNQLTTSDGTFQATPLEPIDKLHHDHLSEFDFPGPQRLRNYLMLARPSTGPLAGRDALVVVSLLASDEIEVRVIARSGDDASSCPDPADSDAGAPGSGRRAYFGLWRLKGK